MHKSKMDLNCLFRVCCWCHADDKPFRGYLPSTYVFPGLIGLFVNPFYFAQKGLCKAISELAPSISGRLLDVGCGSKPYKSLFAVEAYIGLDIDSDMSRKRGIADYLYDGTVFPFTDGSFDAVLCNQVLEHVFNPDEFLA